MLSSKTARTGGRRLTEREWDRALRIQTMGREDETGAKYMPYEPTPYAVLQRLADSGFIRPEDHLLDYGCGKGRAAIFLAARTGCRATGIDRSAKLVAMAEANRAAAGRAARVRFVCASAERYDPRDENVFFFFNPFSEEVLRIALRRVARACAQARLIFYYPSEAYAACLEEAAWLRPAGEIDCRDLFGGSDPRERILIYDADGFASSD
ncbi:MAG: class I SAM-dependent methyltransferase [Clostridia bacterium]|nr:class I SAM-dependent methyltransferase [Clostridia bacterium]